MDECYNGKIFSNENGWVRDNFSTVKRDTVVRWEKNICRVTGWMCKRMGEIFRFGARMD